MKRCRHRSTKHLDWRDGVWRGGAYGTNCYPGWMTGDAVVCRDCGHWLPLGPARDDERTEWESYAAYLAAIFDPSVLREISSWNDLANPDMWELARAIATHEEEA